MARARLTCHVIHACFAFNFCKSRAAYLMPRLTTSRASNMLSAAHKYPGAWMGSQLERFGHFFCLFLCLFSVYSLLQTVSVRPQVLHHGELLKQSSVREKPFITKEITRKNRQVIARGRSPIQDKRHSPLEKNY